MASWLPPLHELVSKEWPESEHGARQAELIGQLQRSGFAMIDLVEALGPFLTTDDDGQRARATSVLAEVVEAVPGAAAAPGELAHLTHFFTSRLTDWPAVRGALAGCLTLLSRHSTAAASSPPSGPAEVEEEAAVGMVRACVSHVFIRALAQPDRALALRLLLVAMRGYGAALLDANLDLFEYTVSSVDGEKDPRCLLLSFEVVRCLLRLYHAQPDTSLCHERLEEGAEELFEVLACYFPVSFTPPPNDPNKISRGDLAAGLEATLAAEPLFAPHVVPLACDKLSSTLRAAKLDALSLLGACAEGHGPALMAGHVSTLWAALRPELLAPAAEGLLAADQPAAEEVAGAAAGCLARCVAALQVGGGAAPAGAGLADAVLQDPILRDMLACIESPGTDAAVQRRSALRARAGARAAEALCRAGGASAARALRQLLPPLLAVAGQQGVQGGRGGRQSGGLAWSAVLGLLEAAAAAPDATDSSAAADGGLVRQAVAAATAALVAAAGGEGDASEEGEELETAAAEGAAAAQQAFQAAQWPLLPDDCSPQRVTTLQLAVLAAVFASPRQAEALDEQQAASAAGCVLQLLLAPPSSRQPPPPAIVAPLAALAGGRHAAMLAAGPLPRLVQAAGRQQTAAPALAALRALAAASASLQLDVLVALDEAIQRQLPAAGASAAADLLLLQLLQAAASIAAAAAADGDAAAAEAGGPACLLQLSQHLLDSAELLPAQAAAAAGPEVQAACAELAYHAVRGASGAQQQPLAAPAAAALERRQPRQAAGLHVAVCCGLLVPLRPEALRGLAEEQPLGDLVQRLVQLATSQQAEGPAGQWAALAAAAVLNKWPQQDADGLAACTAAVLEQQLYPACGLAAAGGGGDAEGLPAAAPRAWACLAAVSRGLAMRGSGEAEAAVARVVRSLGVAARRWRRPQESGGAAGGASGSQLAAGIRAAAHFLGAVLDGGGGGAEGVGLARQAHAVCRPLWQQRLQTAAVAQLLPLAQGSLLEGGAQQAAAAAGPAAASPALLLGLARLLCSAPAGVLKQDQRRMLPWMLRGLEALQVGPLADGPLLLALLQLVSEAIASPEGKQQAESELLPCLVPALLGLAAYRPSPAVREAALRCLLALSYMPYTSLHPHRRAVARALAAAVDDDRRAVRLQAARCRQAWSTC